MLCTTSSKSGVGWQAPSPGQVSTKRRNRGWYHLDALNSSSALAPPLVPKNWPFASTATSRSSFTMFRAPLAVSRAAARRLYSTRGGSASQVGGCCLLLLLQLPSRYSSAPGALSGTPPTPIRPLSFKSLAVPVCCPAPRLHERI